MSTKKESLIRFLKNVDNRIWIVFSMLFVLVFASYCYYLDTVSLVRYEVSFAESIIRGEFSNFYQRTYDVMQIYNSAHSPAYDMPMCFVLGIWGIPLYIYINILGITDVANSFTCLLYGKSILLIATILSTCLIVKICTELGIEKDRAKWGGFIFATSLLTLGCTAVVGQSDIMGIAITLCGILFYIRREYRKFLIFFILAFPFKQYSFFVFLPLLLLKEKNIVKVVLQVAGVFAFTILCNIPIQNSPQAYEFKSEFARKMFGILTQNKLPLVDGVPVTILLWGIVCLFCYLYNNENARERKRITAYVMFASMAAIFVGFDAYCYWYVNLAPYLAILICYNAGTTKKLLLFETIGMISITITNVIKYYWCYDVGNCRNMLPGRLFGINNNDYLTIEHLITHNDFSVFRPVLSTIFFITIIAILWIARPNREITVARDEERLFRKNYIIRAGVNIFIAMIPAGMYICGLLV